ncbi:MAG: iron-sulfur cluster repair di-iron protein [bacterium]|nr:iron-sulfur cluster repair di-iron protein [bacterium]MBK7703931.1 iron-sulfur cluster repair di-iron protein [bacterium]
MTNQESNQERLQNGIDIPADRPVAELVIRHPILRETLERLGVDYCCGGKQPLAVAVAEAGRDWTAVRAELQATLASTAAVAAPVDWSAATLGELIDHILEKHHVFTKAQLLRLDGLLGKVQNAHGAHHGSVLEDLRRVFDGLRAELDAHLMKEEQILFPAIMGIDAFMSGRGERPAIHCGSVGHPIRQMEHEHDGAGQALVAMRRITDGYRLPEDACPTFAALYDGLQALEADLHEHIHLENNLLFPRSVALEEDMNRKPA